MLSFRSAVSAVSATVSAGFSGISGAGATARSNGAENGAKTESHAFSHGEAAASAFGVAENGRVITGAASSVGTSRSSAASSAVNRERFFSRHPNPPVWNNVGPNNENGEYSFDRSARSKLSLVIWPRPSAQTLSPDGFIIRSRSAFRSAHVDHLGGGISRRWGTTVVEHTHA